MLDLKFFLNPAGNICCRCHGRHAESQSTPTTNYFAGEAAEHAAFFLSHFSIYENAYRATACPPTTALPLIVASASSICSVSEKLFVYACFQNGFRKTVLHYSVQSG